MTVISKDDAGTKTRWCDKCKKRFPLDHEHFAKSEDKAANTVTGSISAADLASQAAKGKQAPATRLQMARLEKEQQEQEREALARRWGRRMRVCYGFASKVLDDPKVALNEEEIRDMGEAHADMCLAWGWTASGKIETIADVAMLHVTTIAARSEWGEALLQKLMGKKDDADARGADGADASAVGRN